MSVDQPVPARHATTSEHSAAERRAAARALLTNPILSGPDHAEELALVRRHHAGLRQTFQSVLGYPLVVEPTFARLVKAVPPADTPARGAHRSNGSPLTARSYTYLALVCAGLMAPGTGDQVLLSALVDQLRADAASVDIDVDETLPDRRALVAAIDKLIAWGVLTETDGSVTAWGERREEALLTINRSLLPHLLARPLSNFDSPDEMWNPGSGRPGQPVGPEQPRPALRRRLVEHPLTRRENLTEAEADALSRERRDITRTLDDAFGLALEVRLEGALAYDVDEELTDVDFPGHGTVRQAALLLIDALVDTLRPTASTVADVDGNVVPGLLAPWDLVADNIEHLAEQNARAWRSDVADGLEELTGEVVSVLTEVSLATATADGLVLHPACARYRPEPVRIAAKPRRAPAPCAPGDHAAPDGPDDAQEQLFPDHTDVSDKTHETDEDRS
jgi:uncharacterized protein (TIGR02678 family)